MNKVIVSFQRNFHINKQILKVSFFPNLFDPILTTLVFGVAFSQVASGYTMSEIIIALMINVGVTAVTNEMTYNLFIQYKVQKSITALRLVGNSYLSLFTGHILWAIARGYIFSIVYFIIATFMFGLEYHLSIPGFINLVVLLALVYLFFALLATFITVNIKKIDYINIYISFVLKSLLLFSPTFFPISYFNPVIQPIVELNPFTYIINALRNGNNDINLQFIILWTVIDIIMFVLLAKMLRKREKDGMV